MATGTTPGTTPGAAPGTTPTPGATPPSGATPPRGRTPGWYLTHVAAALVVVALILYALTQCEGKKTERESNETKNTELVRANQALDSLRVAMRDATNLIGGLGAENRAKSDTIRMQRDTIAKLNDSIVVLNGDLDKCRKSKGKPAKPAKPNKPNKSNKGTSTKTAAGNVTKSKPDTVFVVREVPATVSCNKTNVRIDHGSVNNGAIVVGNNNEVTVKTREALIAEDSLARARQIQHVQFRVNFVSKSK